MITCELPGCAWTGYTSEVSVHVFVDHGYECQKCDNGWIEDKHDPERVEKCPRCHGSGRVA